MKPSKSVSMSCNPRLHGLPVRERDRRTAVVAIWEAKVWATQTQSHVRWAPNYGNICMYICIGKCPCRQESGKPKTNGFQSRIPNSDSCQMPKAILNGTLAVRSRFQFWCLSLAASNIQGCRNGSLMKGFTLLIFYNKKKTLFRTFRCVKICVAYTQVNTCVAVVFVSFPFVSMPSIPFRFALHFNQCQ